MKIRIFLILLIFLTYSCQKEEKDPLEKAYKNTAWIETEDDDFPIIGVHEDGSMIAIQADLYGNPIGAVFKKDFNSQGFYVLANENGYPYQAYVNGYVILYNNYTNTTVDVAIVNSDGEIDIVREVLIDFPEPLDAAWNLKSSNIDPSVSFGDILRWTGHVLSIGACAAEIAGTIGTWGGLAPVAIIGCTAAITGVLTELAPKDWVAVRASSAAFSTYASYAGCATSGGLSCPALIAGYAGALVTEAEYVASQNESEIQLAQGGLISPIDNVPADVNEFINEELLNILKDKGLTVYTGFSPPIVEGNYYLNSWKNWETGDEYINYTYKFKNQTGVLKIDVDYTNSDGTSTATANRAYISGSGNNFSIFAEIKSIDDRGSHTVRLTTASIISGIYTSNGIKDFTKGFIVTAKYNDLDDEFMDVEASRIVYESDGLAEKVYSYPYNGLKIKSLKKESENILLKN